MGGGSPPIKEILYHHPPPFLTYLEKPASLAPHYRFVHKNGFCFCFFSLGLGIGYRVMIKMWMMWNNTRPPLYQCWTHNFPSLTLTNKHKRSDLPYRCADALLEAYSKRNPIVVLHNVYMDQNQSCLAAWYECDKNISTHTRWKFWIFLWSKSKVRSFFVVFLYTAPYKKKIRQWGKIMHIIDAYRILQTLYCNICLFFFFIFLKIGQQIFNAWKCMSIGVPLKTIPTWLLWYKVTPMAKLKRYDPMWNSLKIQ